MSPKKPETKPQICPAQTWTIAGMRKAVIIHYACGAMRNPFTSQHMQVLETFRNYIRPVDKEFAEQLAGYTTRFLSAKNHNGYAPLLDGVWRKSHRSLLR